jgi:hypothetical protein
MTKSSRISIRILVGNAAAADCRIPAADCRIPAADCRISMESASVKSADCV